MLIKIKYLWSGEQFYTNVRTALIREDIINNGGILEWDIKGYVSYYSGLSKEVAEYLLMKYAGALVEHKMNYEY